MTIEHRPFGGTGIKVSRHCLGAMMFGAMGNRDEAECVRIVHAALDAGINFIDTADALLGRRVGAHPRARRCRASATASCSRRSASSRRAAT